MGRTFLLSRASNAKQVDSCEVQKSLMEQWCVSNGVAEYTYLEEPPGTSGRKLTFRQRPMGAYLLDTLQEGDCLVVLKVDRLGRRLLDILQTMEALANRKVRVVIIQAFGGRVFDVNSSIDKMVLAILSMVASWEGELIASRTSEALQWRKKNNFSSGGRPGYFSYIQTYDRMGNTKHSSTYDRQAGDYKRNVFDPKIIKQCITVLRMRDEGKSWDEIRTFCERECYVDYRGNQWWKGFKSSESNPALRNMAIKRAIDNLKKIALAGNFDEDVLRAIFSTKEGRTFKAAKTRKKRGKYLSRVVPTTRDRELWTAEEWSEWYLSSQDKVQN